MKENLEKSLLRRGVQLRQVVEYGGLTVLTLISLSCWLPVFSTDDRQANLALFINVGMINLCLKSYLKNYR